MIGFVMIAAMGALVGTIILFAVKKMKIYNNKKKKYSKVSQINEEDVEMHQNEGQNDTDEEEEDGELLSSR